MPQRTSFERQGRPWGRRGRLMAAAVLASASLVAAAPAAQAGPTSDQSKTQCLKERGIWFPLDGYEPSPCWQAAGAFLVNIGKGKSGDGIDHLRSDQSERMKYPNYIVVTKDTWKVCDDIEFGFDLCTHEPLGPGKYDLCSLMGARVKGDTKSTKVKFCSMNDVYIQRR